MIASGRGLELIKRFEGLRLVAYKCPSSVWTIAYGHTAGVKEHDTCTRPQADRWLVEDVKWAEKAIESLVVVPLTQNQFDALVSFVFNVGAVNFGKSTLLRLLNQGDYVGASRQFLLWNRANKKPLAGLTARRNAERLMFMEGYRE